MTDTATIEAPEKTAVATAAAQAIDIIDVNLTTLALAKFGPWREQTATAKAEFAALVLDLQTQSAIDDAISLRNRKIKQPLADARKTAEALKSKLAAVSKAVGAELPLIEAAWADAASAITPRIEAAQQVLDEAKEAARVKEQARKDAHRAYIDTIRGYFAHCQRAEMTAERIQRGIDALAAITVGAEREEFEAEAKAAQAECLEAMRTLQAQAAAREAEAARLEAQRLENERQAAELARARAELEAQAAAVREAAAELDRQRREAERAKAEEDQRKADEAEAAERAEAARVAALAPVTLPTAAVEAADDMALHAEAAALLERGQREPELVCRPVVLPYVQVVGEIPPRTELQWDEPKPEVQPEPDPCREFVDLVMEAFADTKFPSHPKPSPAWWARVRAAGEELQRGAA